MQIGDVQFTKVGPTVYGIWAVYYNLTDRLDKPSRHRGIWRNKMPLRRRDGKPTGQEAIDVAGEILGRSLTSAEQTEFLDTIRIEE